MSFFAELKRRNVVRVGLLYAVAGWLVLQVADVLAGLLGLPDWTLRFVAFLLALGFPIVLVFSWVFELTPEGIKRERDVVRGQSITGPTGRKLNLAIGGLLLLAVALLGGQLLLDRSASPEPVVALDNAAPEAGSNGDAPAATSIAVLPFTNMSSDPENEYFADGLSEELLNVLAQIEGFKVAGRTSSFSFKGKNEDLRQIGRTLNVGTVLEGSVRKSGDQVRITAQLVNVQDGYHLWSATYDRKLNDIFSIQDDIARQVVEALKQTLLASQDQTVLEKRTTDNVQAYQLFLRGRHQIAKRNRQGLELALAAFREAVELDPGFAKAWTGIADAQSLMASYGYVPASDISEDAGRAIDTALALDPSLGDAYASRGLLLTQLGRPAEEIIAQYETALKFNPNNSMAHMWLSGRLLTVDPDAAEAHLQAAYALDPLSGIVVYNLAAWASMTGQVAEARKHAEELLELDPGWPGAHRLLGRIASMEGDAYTWVQADLDVLELDPDDVETQIELGSIFLSLGDLETAAGYIARARQRSPFNANGAAVEAQLLWQRGDRAGALDGLNELLQRQPDDRTTLAFAILVEAQFGNAERTLVLCRRSWNAQEPPPQTSPDEVFHLAPSCAYALRQVGLTQQARALAESAARVLEQAGKSVDVWARHYAGARLASAAGDRDGALQALRQALQRGMSAAGILPLDPWLAAYQDDPEFADLFARLREQMDTLYARLSAEGLTSGQRVPM